MIKKLLGNGPTAVIRLADRKKLDKVLSAIIDGGLLNIEITLTIPGAIDLIKELCQQNNKSLIIGAGTVTTLTECEDVINAGAEFVVSPILDTEIISMTKNCGKISIPGCFSPTEILAAYNKQADIIKVFPATALGPRYFRELLSPFPYLKLMPTGGVSIDNVGDWLAAGAVTVAIGSDLLDKKLILEDNYLAIKEKTIRLMQNFNDAIKMINKN